jgi:hypothetical protein
MTEPRDRLPNIEQHPAVLEEFQNLLVNFSHTSTIGFGICDGQLQYRSVNRALADSNGIPVEDHLGHTVRDILGEASATVEPTLRHVLATGEIISTKISGRLPSREGEIHWIANYFLGKGTGTKTQQIGVVAVDITEIKKLDKFVSRLANPFLAGQDKDSLHRAKEAHDAISQYLMALTASLDRMTQHIWQPDKSADEQLGPTIELLDKRILRIRELVSEVASRFTFDEH